MKLCLSCFQPFESINWKCPACKFEPEIINGYPNFAPELAKGNDGFNPNEFAELANIEEGHFWFESRNKIIMWALGKYFPKAKNFFEVGCGTGFVLSGVGKFFPSLSLYGSDIYTEGLSFADKRIKKASLMQMDATNIPFIEEFDVIGAFDVIEHIDDDITAISQLYKAVKPGGGIILTVPQHMFLWSDADDRAYHKRRYSANELKEKVENAGFKVIKITSFVSFLLPFMFISRKRKNKPKDTFAEFKLNPYINKLLELALSIESLFIKIGIKLPFGGSLLLVAYKL